jgi:hypothetical protein
MPWNDLYPEDAVVRAARLVTAYVGTTTNEQAEVFGEELHALYNELAAAGLTANKVIPVLASLAGLAGSAVGLAGYRFRLEDAADDDGVVATDDASVREYQMQVLYHCADLLHQIRRTEMFTKPDDG